MRLVLLSVVALTAARIGHAQNFLTNGCFQAPASPDLYGGGFAQHDAESPTAAIGAWTTTSGSVDQIWANADGSEGLWVSSPNCGCGVSLELNGVGADSVTQTAFPLNSGTQYTVVWEVSAGPRWW